ncbi:MAG: hypothetical protein N2444_02550 [Methylocystis sp.]|nr:hypothetical protein [Methylocystis sp.]
MVAVADPTLCRQKTNFTMRVNGQDRRTIWRDAEGRVHVIDQRKLPHRFETRMLADCDDAARATIDMIVRGAPLIGVAARRR